LEFNRCKSALLWAIFNTHLYFPTFSKTQQWIGIPESCSKALSTDANRTSSTVEDRSTSNSNSTTNKWNDGKIALCESSSSEDSSSNQNDPNVDKKEILKDITFRQRKLSINNSNILLNQRETKADHTVKDDKKPIPPSRAENKSDGFRIMYASELHEDESNLEKIKEALALNHPKEFQDTSTSTPPFESHQVGTFSCHGIEPHPFVVYDAPEPDTEVTAFFRRMFGVKPTTNVQATAKIITMSKQKINQDRGHVCIYSSKGSDDSLLFGTYDGHGEKGELLAEFTMNALFNKLHNHRSYHGLDEEKDIGRAFHEVFREIDDEIRNHDHLSPLNSGSTACVALLQGRKMWVANVGDSRAVLGRRRISGSPYQGDAAGPKSPPKADSPSQISDLSNLDAIDLSRDQNVHDRMERERILNSGGYITVPQDPELPARIWLDEKCSQIGLAMSRSIGDHALKHVGVIAEPVVKDYDLGDNDEVSNLG
jgi:serine/threonine protein phosphatase PrpC